MARTWTLFALLICGLAVGSLSATTTPPTPTHTSTAPQPPTTSQGPTTSVPPTPPKSSTYTLHNDDGEVCLMMVANMSVIYTYKNASNALSQNVTIEDPILNASTDRSPNCTANEARLILSWEPPSSEGFEADPRFLTLNFSANLNKGSRHWTFDGVDLQVVFSKPFFVDYDNNAPTGDFFYNASGLFKDKVEFQRGYRCDATQEHPLNYRNLTKYMYQISANLTVRDFHVQAFQFKDAGKFGNARRCQKESGDGNKVVPIAVGVALAVLVIAVIIAFFISKLVNRRRQISYESLN